MKRTLAAALFSLLTVSAPAHAAYVYEDINVSFGLPFGFGYNASGQLTFTNIFPPPPLFGPTGTPPTLTGPFPSLCSSCVGWAFYSFTQNYGYEYVTIKPGLHGVTYGIDTAVLSFCCHDIPQSFSDFSLDVDGTNYPALSGTVTVLSETAATPLPPALPLFGSGVIALAGLAWRKRRGEVSE
jgi:hypothetical protein